MKYCRFLASALCVVSLAASFVACSGETTGSTPPAAGASAVGGAVGASGGSNGGAGAQPVGGSGAPAQAGANAVGGSGASGGGAGATGGSAPNGGGAGTGAAGTGGGAAGQAGGAAQAGQGGGSSPPEAELDGAGWTMKCNKKDTSADAMNRCYLLPPGETVCPAAGYTSVDQTLHFGGTPGTHYQVTIHFQGTHEAGDYSGGTADPKQFLRGATHISGGVHTWLSMEVSSPAATYNPNSGGGAGSVQVYDYTATIPIDGGATIRLKAFDKDCLMHRYCQNDNYTDCKGLVQPPISPANAPIDGSFLQMTVTSVVAK
ncbi:MAG: hypothetical protein ABUL62_07895 [Myxococcales bacterium]